MRNMLLRSDAAYHEACVHVGIPFPPFPPVATSSTSRSFHRYLFSLGLPCTSVKNYELLQSEQSLPGPVMTYFELG